MLDREEPKNPIFGIIGFIVMVVGVVVFVSLISTSLLDGVLSQYCVEQVIDGDTIVVSQDGSNHTVRLIGVDAPESVNPDKSLNTPEGVAASNYLATVLIPGQKIWLEQDISDVDKYGRWLRYAYIKDPNGLTSDLWRTEYMVNAMLITSGNAIAKEYPPDTKYADLFNSIQEIVQR